MRPTAMRPTAVVRQAVPAAAPRSEALVTASINRERTTRRLRAYTTKADLVAIARAQAQRMATANRLFHNPHLGSDVKAFRWAGENVGFGPLDPAVVNRAFMSSTSHRANILDRDFSEAGVGAVTSGGRLWVAEVFRAPRR